MNRTPLIALMICACAALPVLSEDFGDRQIAQMLDDRPSMRDIIRTNHAIYRLVSKHFSDGGLNGARVYWDHTEPIDGAENQCNVVCAVRVTKSNKYSGRDKWAMLVFELLNLSYAKANGDLHWSVTRGQISKDDFVMKALEFEINAMRQTQQLLAKHPIPGVASSVDRFYFSFLNTPSTLDEYVRFLDDNKGTLSYDPREYSAKTYELLRSKSRASQDER